MNERICWFFVVQGLIPTVISLCMSVADNFQVSERHSLNILNNLCIDVLKKHAHLPEDTQQIRTQIVLYLPRVSCSIVEHLLVDSNLHNTRPHHAHIRAYRATSPVSRSFTLSFERALSPKSMCRNSVEEFSFSKPVSYWPGLHRFVTSFFYCYSLRESFSYSVSNNVYLFSFV